MAFEKISFKKFMIKENIELLGEKIGSIYSKAKNLQDSFNDIGPKMTAKELQGIISDIQSVIKGHLAVDNKKNMGILQDLGVAISKEIDPKNKEKNGMEWLMSLVTDNLEQLSTKLGVPINDLGVSTNDDASAPEENKDSTTKPKDLDINPAAQPVSGFDSGAVPALGNPPEQQNPNSV
jgi:hypothetical protein